MAMQLRVLRAMLFGAVLALWCAPVGVWAQTTGTGTSAQPGPRDQKIAQALFDAQTKSTASNAPKPLTLDEIVAMKRGHEGWGEVFKDMKSKGLLTQKNLGEVVKDFERQHHETVKLEKADKADKADKAEKADKPTKPERVERMEKPERPDRPGR
jgi:hypothetical protein